MKTLREVYRTCCDEGDNGGGDKGTVHSYIELYEHYLQPKLVAPITLLEIGIFKGHSMLMWRDYLPRGSTIIGVDIINRLEFPQEGFTCVWGNILHQETLERIALSSYDVIIDDGSHQLRDQMEALDRLLPLLKTGGLYFVEDIGDNMGFEFEKRGFTVHDLRPIKNRADDVLAVYQK